MTRTKRVCGEQDCKEYTSRANHFLCYSHYMASHAETIDECPNHPGVYKPKEYPICRQCYVAKRQIVKTTPSVREKRERYSSGGSGWDKLYSEPKSILLSTEAIEAVSKVRKNMSEHGRECTLHESNTIQYLVEPILKGLGWDFSNPQEVIREFNPEGRRRFGNIAVDIALLEDGEPKVFVEAKRLDRDYDPDYKKQIDKYASYMERGIAVLTNGQFWLVSPVRNGRPENVEVIDISKGPAEDVAGKLHSVIAKSASERANRKSSKHPADIKEQLREYRTREAKRRNKPEFTIFNNGAIELIAAIRPSDLNALANIKGFGPLKIEKHGAAILKIVKG